MYFKTIIKITCLFSSILSRPTSSRRHTVEDKFSNRWAEPFSVRTPAAPPRAIQVFARKLPTIKQSGTAHAASSRYPLPIPSVRAKSRSRDIVHMDYTRTQLSTDLSLHIIYSYYNYRVFVSFIHTYNRKSIEMNTISKCMRVYGYHFLEDELTVKPKKY